MCNLGDYLLADDSIPDDDEHWAEFLLSEQRLAKTRRISDKNLLMETELCPPETEPLSFPMSFGIE